MTGGQLRHAPAEQPPGLGERLRVVKALARSPGEPFASTKIAEIHRASFNVVIRRPRDDPRSLKNSVPMGFVPIVPDLDLYVEESPRTRLQPAVARQAAIEVQ